MGDTHNSGCGCGCGGSGNCCATTPPEFVRLRYFFGQRLGVVDFQDEQSYFTGKQRLHNRLLHGVGIVCGLNVTRFVFPQNAPPNTPTTVLRVTRGMAIDACGREVLVGADQCIDVNAWFQANRANPELAAATIPGTLDLFVALRYRDCPSDPSPAPRDACGCGSNGCEYGRIRESFQLSLLTEAEFSQCATTVHPSVEELEDELAASAPLRSDGIAAAWQRLAAKGCSDGAANACLGIARIRISLAAGPVVDDITSVDIEIPERLTLMPTYLLQAIDGADVDSASAGGPRISGVTFTGTADDSGSFAITLTLGSAGNPPVATPLAEPTLTNVFALSQFDPAAGTWTAVTFTESYAAPTVSLKCSGNLGDGRLYRLVLDMPSATPVVDQRMRALTPEHFATHFRLVAQGGVLVVASSLF